MNQTKPTYKQQGNVGLFEQLFDKFYKFLEENHLIMKEGVMIDGSFVEAHR